jgi:L-lactate dehydrogenase complex protein LldG
VSPATRESGDRTAFLGHLRRRLAAGVPENLAHPLPGELSEVPVARSSRLDPADVVGSFVRNATDARVVVHELAGATVPDAFVADLVRRHGVRRAVVSAEPEAQAVGAQLAALGVDVAALTIDAASRADLGVTAAVAAFATTGSLVQDAAAAGGRTASLLPPVHLCVLSADRILPSTAELVRHFGEHELPSNIVFVTGPSRSGDIEQIITLGVHGPLAVEVALLTGADSRV